MGKKRDGKKKRGSSSDSDSDTDRRSKALSKFQTFEVELPEHVKLASAAAQVTYEPLKPYNPADYTPAPQPAAPSAPPPPPVSTEELVPLHSLPGAITQSIAPTGGASGTPESLGGLIKEPEPPQEIIRVTKEGAMPPPIPMSLLSYL
mmetsp:Transcript_21618/g.25107  ORF Transcript_21618/g.25107 Transcript_21618/m.25107 type:complete len:148 (-) Transcript_21618:184-627(-)